MSVVDKIVSVRLEDDKDALVILDQTLLPNEVKYLELKSKEAIFEAIAGERCPCNWDCSGIWSLSVYKTCGDR